MRGKYISNPNYTGVGKTDILMWQRGRGINFGQICEMPFMNGPLGLKLKYHLASLLEDSSCQWLDFKLFKILKFNKTNLNLFWNYL